MCQHEAAVLTSTNNNLAPCNFIHKRFDKVVSHWEDLRRSDNNYSLCSLWIVCLKHGEDFSKNGDAWPVVVSLVAQVLQVNDRGHSLNVPPMLNGIPNNDCRVRLHREKIKQRQRGWISSGLNLCSHFYSYTSSYDGGVVCVVCGGWGWGSTLGLGTTQ